MSDNPTILFDGVCNFCNGAVNFTIRRDGKKIIRFAPLQSDAGAALAAKHGVNAGDMSSFLLVENGKLYSRSTAALRVCRYLNAGWPLLYAFIVVPRFVRDGIYNWIAKNRYKWFGERDSCMIPTPDVRARFL